MNFLELKNKVRGQLWVEGEGENLIAVHDAFFQESLFDLGRYVPCYQFGNSDVYAHCSTYFQCGMTVLPAPRGHITRVYVMDREPSEVESGDTTAPRLKFINPAASIVVSAETIGTTVSKTYTINPAEGTLVSVMGATNGVGTAFSLTATVRITPTDGSADTVEKVYTVTDGFLSFDPEELLASAEADAYTVEIVIELVGLSGNQSQWVQQGRSAEINISYSQTAAAPQSPPDWCSKVDYQQVEYCRLQSFGKLCERCGSGSNLAVVDAFLASVFGSFRTKRNYPAPTDAGFESLPKLPQGFHYPQASTDASGRSPYGFWAIHRGRIYVSPWIQSSETVVIEWNGIKRKWADTDLVEDDPKFIQAVRLHVGMQHAFAYDNDQSRYQMFKDQFYGNIPAGIPGALPELIHECHEENRLRRCGETGTSSSAARGIGTSTDENLFTNERQSYTASCPSNMEGDSVTSVVEAGEVSSALSVADANARALSLAQQRANDQLVCAEPVITYLNAAQSYTAYCQSQEGYPPPDGAPVTVTVQAGAHSSTASQAAADAAALADATAQANAQLTCTFWNSEQSYTASCISPATGSDVTKTVPAHTYSAVTQALADSLALTDATNQANIELVCDTPPTVYWNTTQIGAYSNYCAWVPGNLIVRVTVPAGTFSSIESQNAANTLAKNAGNQYAHQQFFARCVPSGGGGIVDVDGALSVPYPS